MKDRFKVDERVGCAAVVDTFWPDIGNGLDSDAPWVVEWSDLPRDNEDERKVKLCVLGAICSKLNEENSFTQERLMELRRNLTNAALELEEAFACNRNYSTRNLRDLMT